MRRKREEGRKTDRGEVWLKKKKEEEEEEEGGKKERKREGNKIQRNETRALAKETDGPR